MNLKQAEIVAENPDSVSVEIRREVLEWAGKRRFSESKSVSPELRQKANQIYLKIYAYYYKLSQK